MPKWRNNDKEAKICKNWSHCQVLKTLLMWKASDSSNARLFNWSTFQLVDCSTDRLFIWSTVQLIDCSTDRLFNLSTVQLIDSSTYRQFNLSTVQQINFSTCRLFNWSTFQLVDSSTRRLIRVSFTRAIYLATMSQPYVISKLNFFSTLHRAREHTP